MQELNPEQLQSALHAANGQLANYKIKFAETSSELMDLKQQMQQVINANNSVMRTMMQAKAELEGKDLGSQALAQLFATLPSTPAQRAPTLDELKTEAAAQENPPEL